MRAGDEVTYAYSESPSKALLLSGFGFDLGAPSATISAAELPAAPRSRAYRIVCCMDRDLALRTVATVDTW